MINAGLIEDKENKIGSLIPSDVKSSLVSPSGHLEEGVRSAQQGNFSNAINSYRKAVLADPTDATAYQLLGYTHFKEGDYESAIKYLQASIAINPEYAWGYYNLSLALWGAGQKTEAIEQIKKVLNLDTRFANIIRDDLQFKAFRENPEFERLIYGQ